MQWVNYLQRIPGWQKQLTLTVNSFFQFAHYIIFVLCTKTTPYFFKKLLSIFSYTSFKTKSILFYPRQESGNFFVPCFTIHCYSKLLRIILNITISKPAEAIAQRCSVRKVFIEISQNSQESTCARVSFTKKETLTPVFSSEFCEIFKNTFLQNTSWWMLLSIIINLKSYIFYIF